MAFRGGWGGGGGRTLSFPGSFGVLWSGGLLRFSVAVLFAVFDLEFVSENDADVTGALADRSCAAAGFRLKALGGRTFPHDGLLDHEIGHIQVVVVLGVRDGAGERLSYEAGCLLRYEAQQIQGVRSRKPLDFPCNLPGLEGRNPGETVCRSNLHLWCFLVGVKLVSGGHPP